MKPGVATKRKLDQDPDYEDAPAVSPSKQPRSQEEDAAREHTVKKIEGIIRKQFALEGKQKEKEVELIDERIHQVRVMLDKLRACIVASYYGNIRSHPHSEKSKPSKTDMNHPAIKRMIRQQVTPLCSQENSDDQKATTEERSSPDSEILSRVDSNSDMKVDEPEQDTEKVDGQRISDKAVPQREGFRYDVRKRIIVGNVSKYISTDQREESDPSTHKWMVYVRGPSNEPSIDHFVKKVWFFLHPSYRPNDLVEVKEPPFHLTRRGWGEFPIRIQLHFVDPRNKKVDIIHQIKLDRTYTGLQTLGAETIVDVELDRYLTDDSGFSNIPCPASPAITNVNYREGCKPQILSKSLSASNTPTCSSSTTPVRQTSISMPVSPEVSKARKEALDKMVENLSNGPYLESSLGHLITSVEESTKTITNPETDYFTSSPERRKEVLALPMDTESSSTTIINSSEDFKMVTSYQSFLSTRMMPPLGPITSGPRMSSPSTIRLEKVAEKLEKFDSVIQNAKVSENAEDVSSGAVNVADMASKTSPGKMAVRIQHGKVVTGSEEGSKEGSQSKMSLPVSTVSAPTTSTAKTIITASSVPVNKLVSSSGASTSSLASFNLSKSSTPAPVLTPISTPDPKIVTADKTSVATPVKKVQGGLQNKRSSTHVAIPQAPHGTQYYITATSSDPNLQGKVILIPQQVFSQAPASKAASRSNVAKSSHSTAAKLPVSGKKAPGAASKGPFLSPSNVLILPQGSIVPALPSGSIVQIQQVPTPANKATLVQTQGKKSPSVPLKVVNTSKLTAPKLQTVNRSTTPTAGLIQIQRTPKAGAIQCQAGGKSQGVSLLSDQKSQLVRTQSGSVVLVQRSSTARQPGTSGMAQVKIAHHIPILTQKVTSQASVQHPTSTSTKTMVTIGQSVMPSIGQSIVIATPKPTTTSVSGDTQLTKIISSKGISLITGQIGVVKESGLIKAPLLVAKSLVKVQGLTILGGKSSVPLTSAKEIVKASSPVESHVQKLEAVATGSEVVLANTSSTKTAMPSSRSDSVHAVPVGVKVSNKVLVPSGIPKPDVKKFIIMPIKHEPKPSVQQVVHHILHHGQAQSSSVLSHGTPTLKMQSHELSMLKLGVRVERTVEVPPKKGIDLAEVTSMINLVKAVVKRIPMINKIGDLTVFPFCAASLEQFKSWHVIKRKACEWQRAVAIKENVKKLILDAKKSSFDMKDVWTTKQIMVWCRNNGYMPYVKDKNSAMEWCGMCGEVKRVIDEEENNETEEHGLMKCKEKWLSELGFLKTSSYTSPDELRCNLQNKLEQSKNTFQDYADDDVEIDVVSIDNPLQVIVKREPSRDSQKPKLYMPPSEGATLTEEVCQQIGIKLKQTEVCEDVFAPITQEMLFCAAKQFMSDLVRGSLAQAYKNRSDCRPPEEVLPNDVYKAVVSSPGLEFLTNNHLGMQTRSGKHIKEEADDDDE